MKGKKHGRIDKNELHHGITVSLVDKGYRRSFEGRYCMASRNGIDACMRPAVGAHCDALEYPGMANKTHDYFTFPLCVECHSDQELYQGGKCEWWAQYVLKPQMRRNYEHWKRTKEITWIA